MQFTSPSPRRYLAPFMADDFLIQAAIDATQQGNLDAYNWGTRGRTSLSISNYAHAQIMHHLVTRLENPIYMRVPRRKPEQGFIWKPEHNQSRLISQGRYNQPTRVLTRAGKLRRGQFQTNIGPLTVEMLSVDHRKYSSQMVFDLNMPEKVDENFQDIYFIYDFVRRTLQPPFLTTYLVFPLPPTHNSNTLPFLECEVIFRGDIGPNTNPIGSTPTSPSDAPTSTGIGPLFDFDVPEKQAA